jgi:hypothetical protein
VVTGVTYALKELKLFDNHSDKWQCNNRQLLALLHHPKHQQLGN